VTRIKAGLSYLTTGFQERYTLRQRWLSTLQPLPSDADVHFEDEAELDVDIRIALCTVSSQDIEFNANERLDFLSLSSFIPSYLL
jgi:hypothetical protein